VDVCGKLVIEIERGKREQLEKRKQKVYRKNMVPQQEQEEQTTLPNEVQLLHDLGVVGVAHGKVLRKLEQLLD